MAYAAVVSLKQILEKLILSSDQHQLPLLTPFPKSQMESLHEKLSFLLSFLEKNDLVPERSSTSFIHELESQIIDALHEAGDIVESHIVSKTTNLLPSEDSGGEVLLITQKFVKVLQRVESYKNDVVRGREKEPVARMRESSFVLSRFLKGSDQKLFGREQDVMKLKAMLPRERMRRLVKVAVVGMLGIGKTALVSEVYDDPIVGSDFEYQDWVSVGPARGLRHILLSLVKHVPSAELSDWDLIGLLHRMLKPLRYLIVLDDITDVDTLHQIRMSFPDAENGSRVIFTTRLKKAASIAGKVHELSFLDEEKSWDLLRYAAIGDQQCPPELVKIGKTIAKNCQGLPLKLVVLGSLLSLMSPDPEEWRDVADDHGIQNREMLRVMQNMDHEKLPHNIKACFLYMVAFPQYQQISVSKLLALWIAEGFLEPPKSKSIEVVAEECLKDLIDRSLVVLDQKSSTSGRIKTCSIHSAIWPFYEFVAAEHKIFQTIESYKNAVDATHRRFSIHKNILFAIKDLHESMASVTTSRSLLCSGPYHPYPLRVMLSFMLLKVLDATSIRFYKFPVEIVKLLLLRFLALTLNKGELPSSVSNLGQLQFLIVRRHSSIISARAPVFLPVEIWEMKELKHLQVIGNDLPAPCDADATLSNLLTLLDVGVLSCTAEVLGRIPNLKKLGTRIELGLDTAVAPLHVFDHLAHLEQLETLKYIVVNPVLRTQVAVLTETSSIFPRSLNKLTLSGCELAWESIDIIGRLPCLEVLKLRCNAFRGPEWKIGWKEFRSLRFLHLEDLDIQQWEAHEKFRGLERLNVHHCYKLQDIPIEVLLTDGITIELVESPPAAALVKKIQDLVRGLPEEGQKELGQHLLNFNIHSSWADGANRKS